MEISGTQMTQVEQIYTVLSKLSIRACRLKNRSLCHVERSGVETSPEYFYRIGRFFTSFRMAVQMNI